MTLLQILLAAYLFVAIIDVAGSISILARTLGLILLLAGLLRFIGHGLATALLRDHEESPERRTLRFIAHNSVQILLLLFAGISLQVDFQPNLLVAKILAVGHVGAVQSGSLVTAILWIAIVGIATIWGGSLFVQRVTAGCRPVQETTGRAGRMIGFLERVICVVLILLGQWSSVALVFTAKSIARFKALEEQNFAEYYLLGTLASVTWATGCGLLLRWLFTGY
jgi:hypothetical protein